VSVYFWEIEIEIVNQANQPIASNGNHVPKNANCSKKINNVYLKNKKVNSSQSNTKRVGKK